MIHEKAGMLERAGDFYRIARENAARDPVFSLATKRLSILLKKQKLYGEAIDLWRVLSEHNDADAVRELSIHYEHRERNYRDALVVVERAFERLDLTPSRRQDMEKRLQRLRSKIAKLQAEEL
jgi:tetratricopeptide (TPR) repeat protein